MRKECRKDLAVSVVSFVAFLLWTVALLFIDVNPIGPEGSKVGLSSINYAFHNLTGVNMTLYDITDLLGLVPIAIMLLFAIIGLLQLIKRKKLTFVDFDILVLGVFYVVLFIVFLAFEVFAVNYRPVLINGHLEVSYPSSTTLLVMCVIPTAIMRLKKPLFNLSLALFGVFMVVARTISGVHWITDIVGGILISTCLVSLYSFIINIKTTPKV